MSEKTLQQDVEKTKRFFLTQAREHDSGYRAEEWMRALRQLCEAERTMRLDVSASTVTSSQQK